MNISKSDTTTIIRAAKSLRNLRPEGLKEQNAIRLLQIVARKLQNRMDVEATQEVCKSAKLFK